MKSLFFSLLFLCVFSASCVFGAMERDSVFLSHERILDLQKRVDGGVEPTATAFRELKERVDNLPDRGPQAPESWYVPLFYVDAQGHRTAKGSLEQDANAAYELALCYRITGEASYARRAVRLIDGWSGLAELSKRDDSTLSFSYHFPAMIFAASLLEIFPEWEAEKQEKFRHFVREKALPMNTMDRQNNWGNWGLVLVLASASYLEDDALVATGAERWKAFIERQIADDGHLPHEVGRNNGVGERGIWYSHFTLMPQTLAAEILSVYGIDLYEYRSPSRRTLRMAYETLAPWARDPSTFPYFKSDEAPEQLGTAYVGYFEILNARWPNEDAEAMLTERRPLTASHSAPALTLTHGQATKSERNP